ncbi:MAG: hypothetical protein ACYS1A_16595, partial [Planctomycetota bacterium]
MSSKREGPLSKQNNDLDKTEIFLNVSDNLTKIYTETAQILQETIKAGKTNIPLGLMGFVAYIDLLHGGAYKGKLSSLPYYNPEVQDQLQWQERQIENILRFFTGTPSDIDLGNGTIIALPMGAKPEQAETMINSDEPHIFPKLLSDQAYFVLKEWASLFLTERLIAGASTSLTSLVEAPTRAIKPLTAARRQLEKKAAT